MAKGVSHCGAQIAMVREFGATYPVNWLFVTVGIKQRVQIVRGSMTAMGLDRGATPAF